MTKTSCKNCTYPVDTGCMHPQCLNAHAQGFCSRDCQIAYQQIKDYELKRAAND
jgi:hypothetical protein